MKEHYNVTSLPQCKFIYVLSPICSVWAEAMHLYVQRSYDREQHNLSVLLCYSILRRGIVFCMLQWEFEAYMMNVWLNELKRRWGMMCKKIHYCSVLCIFLKQRMAGYFNRRSQYTKRWLNYTWSDAQKRGKRGISKSYKQQIQKSDRCGQEFISIHEQYINFKLLISYISHFEDVCWHGPVS